jgi:hypothetical protein
MQPRERARPRSGCGQRLLCLSVERREPDIGISMFLEYFYFILGGAASMCTVQLHCTVPSKYRKGVGIEL